MFGIITVAQIREYTEYTGHTELIRIDPFTRVDKFNENTQRDLLDIKEYLTINILRLSWYSVCQGLSLYGQKYWYQNFVCIFSWLSQFFNLRNLKNLGTKIKIWLELHLNNHKPVRLYLHARLWGPQSLAKCVEWHQHIWKFYRIVFKSFFSSFLSDLFIMMSDCFWPSPAHSLESTEKYELDFLFEKNNVLF